MTHPGVAVARVLAGSWRPEPPPVDFSAELLATAEPRLMAGSAAGMAWWRIRGSALADTPTGARLREAFRLYTLSARVHMDQVVRVVTTLQGNGFEPILIKGWDAARMYPSQGLRPYGDLDLWLDDPDAARPVLASLPDGSDVDLEHDVEASGSGVPQILAAGRVADLEGTSIPVPCEEDRLRILAIHYLKNGGWRPTGLCDVAAAVESRASAFDWQRCLTPDPAVRSWVLAALALAGRLLGADVRNTPAELGPPRWLVSSVLSDWRDPRTERFVMKDPLPPPWHPIALARRLPDHLPHPVASAVLTGAPLTRRHPVGPRARSAVGQARGYLGSRLGGSHGRDAR